MPARATKPATVVKPASMTKPKNVTRPATRPTRATKPTRLKPAMRPRTADVGPVPATKAKPAVPQQRHRRRGRDRGVAEAQGYVRDRGKTAAQKVSGGAGSCTGNHVLRN